MDIDDVEIGDRVKLIVKGCKSNKRQIGDTAIVIGKYRDELRVMFDEQCGVRAISYYNYKSFTKEIEN